jgi:hypothetical protein
MSRDTIEPGIENSRSCDGTQTAGVSRMIKLAAIVALALGACAARAPTVTTSSRDALARYATGASLDQIAADLGLDDRDAARSLVRDALVDLNRRYYGRR